MTHGLIGGTNKSKHNVATHSNLHQRKTKEKKMKNKRRQESRNRATIWIFTRDITK